MDTFRPGDICWSAVRNLRQAQREDPPVPASRSKGATLSRDATLARMPARCRHRPTQSPSILKGSPDRGCPLPGSTSRRPSKREHACPKGTLAKVRVTIRPGGYDNPEKEAGPAATPPSSPRDGRGVTQPCRVHPSRGHRIGTRRKIWSVLEVRASKTKGPRGRSPTLSCRNMLRARLRCCINAGCHPRGTRAAAERRFTRSTGFNDLDASSSSPRIDVRHGTTGGPGRRIEIRRRSTRAIANYAQLMGRIAGPRPRGGEAVPGHPAPAPRRTEPSARAARSGAQVTGRTDAFSVRRQKVFVERSVSGAREARATHSGGSTGAGKTIMLSGLWPAQRSAHGRARRRVARHPR